MKSKHEFKFYFTIVFLMVVVNGLLQLLLQMTELKVLFSNQVYFYLASACINIFFSVLASGIVAYTISQNSYKKIKKVHKIRKAKAKAISYFTSLDKLKNDLLILNTPIDLCYKLAVFIKATFQVNHATIFLWDDEKCVFLPNPPTDENKVSFFIHHPFILWLMDNDKIFIANDFLTKERYEKIKNDALNFIAETKADIIIPMTLNDSLLGIMVIGRKIDNSDFTRNEVNKFLEIKKSTGLSIGNSILYNRLSGMTENLEEKVKQRTKDLNEKTKALQETQSQLIMSEKMASLGVMVAGIAHEINTPAGVINGSADNLESNISYMITHLRSLERLIKFPELYEKFYHILKELLKNTEKMGDLQGQFILKKNLKKKFIALNIDENLAGRLATFIIEKRIQGCESELIQIVIESGIDAFYLLEHISQIQRNLNNIKYSIKSVVKIIKALKYYSHIDQANFIIADITEGIENTLIIMNNQLKHGVEVIKNYIEKPIVPCYIDELNQVWTNIFQNAIHAMKGRGILTITTYTKEKYAYVEIKDTGYGIPPEVIDRIWDPFFTTKKQGDGSGLGLGIVKGIIEKHKGKISVNSKPGETIFTIQLSLQAS
ncbi:MAG: GHKL domain-containing protein [Leptospiraceae bacterium]|nr:GHKL domain-containing protein [Leptospiraceae bacterium]MCP5493073.1 GHKL domain-containing protein [Leptospiraceae bacterium]